MPKPTELPRYSWSRDLDGIPYQPLGKKSIIRRKVGEEEKMERNSNQLSILKLELGSF